MHASEYKEYIVGMLFLMRVSNLFDQRGEELQRELTGLKCPAAGGPNSKVMTPEQKEIDHQARLTISRELGHEREGVTCAYLGR
jgi:type I restriction-modification system DNA methylase subunit